MKDCHHLLRVISYPNSCHLASSTHGNSNFRKNTFNVIMFWECVRYYCKWRARPVFLFSVFWGENAFSKIYGKLIIFLFNWPLVIFLSWDYEDLLMVNLLWYDTVPSPRRHMPPRFSSLFHGSFATLYYCHLVPVSGLVVLCRYHLLICQDAFSWNVLARNNFK